MCVSLDTASAVRTFCASLGCCLLLWIGSSGCAKPQADPLRFIPTPTLAMTALRVVLTERVTGTVQTDLRTDLPELLVIDTHERPDAKLTSFKILGERPTDTGRMFVVELQWSNSTGPERVRFVLVGIDPLLVFREEDLAMISHWDHVMPDPQPASPPATPPT